MNVFVHKTVCVTGLPVSLKFTDAEWGNLSLITSKCRENGVMTDPPSVTIWYVQPSLGHGQVKESLFALNKETQIVILDSGDS